MSDTERRIEDRDDPLSVDFVRDPIADMTWTDGPVRYRVVTDNSRGAGDVIGAIWMSTDGRASGWIARDDAHMPDVAPRILAHRDALERGHTPRQTYEYEAAALDGSHVMLVSPEAQASSLVVLRDAL
jgi:hypothetical protein